MLKKNATYSWLDKLRYSWQDCKLLLLTPLGALLTLYGFTTTWLSYSNTSGWEMALDFASKDLISLPGVAPSALALLCLVPCTALLLLGWGIARLFWRHLFWVRIWLWFLVCMCLVLMSSFCFPLFPPQNLQNLHSGGLQAGFWLTIAALLLSSLGLLIPDPKWWSMDAGQQLAPETQDACISRRHALTRVVNLGGLLAVGSVVGLDLVWLARPRVMRRQVLSIEGIQYSPLNGMRRLVWSSDNASLLECLSRTVHSWEIATGQVTQTYISPFSSSVSVLGETDKSFNNLALSPDGRWLAASLPYDGIIIWEAASGHFVQHFAPTERDPSLDTLYGAVAWSPDGASLATSKFVSGNQAALFILRASDLKQMATYLFSDIASAVVWSGDGRMLAIIADQVEVWDISRGKKIWTYQPPSFSEANESWKNVAADVAWAPDSRHLAISLSAGSTPGDGVDDQPSPVLIWDIVANRQVLSCQGHWGSANGLAWSPDGTRLAASGSDWTVQVWNAQTGARLLTYQGHRDKVESIAWSPDGRFLASSSIDHTIQIWEAPRL